jgi:outer membrane protein
MSTKTNLIQISCRHWILLIVCLVPFHVMVAQQEAVVYSLGDAVKFALQNQPTIKNARIDSEIAVKQSKEILGKGLPQVSAGLDFTHYISLPTSLIPAEFFGGETGEFVGVRFGTSYNATASIEASQLIFSSSYIFALQASRVFAELTRKQLIRSETDIIASVSKAFYSVLLNRERLKLIDAHSNAEIGKRYKGLA